MTEEYFCGPQWWPKIIRRWLSQRFNECCQEHDKGYESLFVARSVTDNSFRHCLFCKAWPLFRWEIVAVIYGWGVTLLGWAFKEPRQWFWKK